MPASGVNYLSASGAVKRRVFCKAAGLTGQELRLCKAKIKAVCGRKPVCPPVIGSSKCHKNKTNWENCARNLFVEYEKEVKGAAQEPVDESSTPDGQGGGDGNGSGEKAGFPQWAKYALIGVGGVILIVGGVAVIKAVSKKKAMPQSVMARR